MNWLIWTVVALILLPPVAWLYFAAIMGLADAEDELHPALRFLARYIALPFGLLLDVAVNIELSLLLFQRLPRAVLFTGMLKWLLINEPNDGWRCRTAAWICTHALNPLDNKRKHC